MATYILSSKFEFEIPKFRRWGSNAGISIKKAGNYEHDGVHCYFLAYKSFLMRAFILMG